MKPIAAALAGALVAGIGMYAAGTRSAQNPLVDSTAVVRTADGGYASVPVSALKPLSTQGVAQPVGTVGYTSFPAAAAPGTMPAVTQPTAAPLVTQYITPSAPAPAQVVQTVPAQPVYEVAPRQTSRVVYTETRTKPKRSWKKSALVIGGSAASGAGVGALIGGKKGALIGTAVGGGAATLFEATKH